LRKETCLDERKHTEHTDEEHDVGDKAEAQERRAQAPTWDVTNVTNVTHTPAALGVSRPGGHLTARGDVCWIGRIGWIRWS
jgi:hypothetical protein